MANNLARICFRECFFTPQSDGPANWALLLLARFIMPWKVESEFCLPKFNSQRVGEPLPRTLSQMMVSREAILTNKSLQMPIRANSLLNFFNFGSRDEDISIDSDLPQVSICVNSLAESFNSRFSELPLLSIFFLSSSLYLSEGNVDLSNRYSTFCDFRGR